MTFNDSRSDSEITMQLNITTENVADLSNHIKIYDYDTCETIEYDSTIVNATVSAADSIPDTNTDDLFSAVPVNVDLNTTTIASLNNSIVYPGFFNTQNNSVILQFCLKPTLGSIEVNRNGVSEESYISYTKIKVQIELDMTMDFTTAVVNIRENVPSQLREDAKVEYTCKLMWFLMF